MSATNNINEINKSSGSSLITLKELCEDLSVSVATGRNWIRLGKITPEKVKGGTVYFTSDYARKLKSDITSGKVKALKSRRNKKYISGNNLYNSYVSPDCKGKEIVQKLLAILDEEKLELTDDFIKVLVADCALKLFLDAGMRKEEISTNGNEIGKSHSPANSNVFIRFLKKEITYEGADELINDLIEDSKAALSFASKYPRIFELEYFYEKNEDVLGLIFISCSNMGKRKHRGAYYTPNEIVKKLIGRALDGIDDSKTVLDPCCGTGNFLLQLPDNISFENIYGNDIDPVSVKIARINMALKYGNTDPGILKEHITCGNFLEKTAVQSSAQYDIILGNPPWGYVFPLRKKKFSGRSFTAPKVQILNLMTYL